MASSPRLRIGSLLLQAALLFGPGSASAEPSATEKETARQLLVSGRTKRESGDLKAALEDFQRAHAIMKVPMTGLELGRIEIALGRLVEARDTLLEVSRMEVPASNATFVKARDEAKKLADEVSPKVPTLTLELSGVTRGDGTEVTLDGAPILAENISLKVNPGKHEVVAKRGSLERTGEATLAEGERKTITIEMAAAAGASASGGGGGDVHPLVWVGFSTAGAGVLLGSVFGGVSISLYGDVAPRCRDSVCPPETHDDYDAGVVYGWLSTGSFALGGIGLGVGILGLFLPEGGDAEPEKGALWLTPLVGPDRVGVRGVF